MSDFESMTELITQDYLSYKLQELGFDFESFSKWPTVYCQRCKSKLETEVITHCDNCDDTKMFSVPENKAPCQRELKFTRKVCDLYLNDFEKRFDIDTANIKPNKATVQITFLEEADNLFEKETDWMGIVGLLILSGVLATRCAEKGYISEVKSIQCITSWYINEKLETWMKEHGGWGSFSIWTDFIIELKQFKERYSKRMDTSEAQRRLNILLDSIMKGFYSKRLDTIEAQRRFNMVLNSIRPG
ncbi:hypothetical protein MAR_007592 [Mya arenaria]|uniref:Bcl-2 Bcl-2 homology region 1-3 domain-containing protein n=1 Tax=Mya arenaria TaxID=6604 RepID=A0ABY7DES5_MYAAR|nr:bcl-2-like protein 1 isoform X2 [Mya arenaria]XP_052806269.1 bcl-2-like protein 1 isoform X2 [Mya arenaria]WAQ95121.1 hypothetical protein MAR_007592 [Mya arenaria]